MTAEKIADHINGIVRDAHEDFMGNDQAKQDSVRLIQDYAKQKCKEKEQKIRDEFDKHDVLTWQIVHECINESQEPEFD